jgi:hypothetical protein
MKKSKVRKAADAVRKRLEAEKNNAKIDAVFRKAAKRVLQQTSDQVLVSSARFFDVGGFGKRCQGDEGGENTFEGLFASHVTFGIDDSADYLLAEVIRGENGFTCLIRCDGNDFYCEDSGGLAGALQDMLELESTAAAFEELMNDDKRGTNRNRCRRYLP